ncbi:MAG: hypothetical protein GX256_06310 [Fretibacterium sp.]|nr:hypothetical protein [Fretibacterium sp.]
MRKNVKQDVLPSEGRCGFTLVEVLTATMIAIFVGSAILLVGRWTVLISVKLARQAEARNRGRYVLSLLEPRVLHVGLGLPSSPVAGSLQAAFGADGPPPGSWRPSLGALQIYRDNPGTVQEAGEGGVFKGSAFLVFYSVPSGLRLGVPTSAAEGAVQVPLLPSMDGVGSWGELFSSGRRRDLRCWISLPPLRRPFYVSDRSQGRLQLEPAVPTEVPAFGEVHFLRCERFHVRDGTLYSQEMQETWFPPNSQPRVDGVLAMWVEWTPAMRLCEVWILTCGGEAALGPGMRPARWPEEAPWEPEFGKQELYVSRASWRLRNL